MWSEVEVEMGARLRRRRRLVGMTQQELGDACGVRFQQIQKYECAANRISAIMLWRLAVALDVRVDYFFDGLRSAPAMGRAMTEPRGFSAST